MPFYLLKSFEQFLLNIYVFLCILFSNGGGNMSLIRCPECKQAMSDTLSVCPHCGYNLSDEEKIKAYGDAILNPVEIKEETKEVVKEVKEIPNYLESEATARIGGRTYVDGHLRMNNGMFSFKKCDSYWNRRYTFPPEWEDIFHVNAIKAMKKIKIKEWTDGQEHVDTFLIKTNSGNIIYLSPVDFKRFDEYFASLNIPYLTDEELGIPPEKIKYTMNHDTKVGLITTLVIIGVLMAVGIAAIVVSLI